MGGDADGWRSAARAALPGIEAALRRRDLAPRVRERLEMVKGVALGQPLDAIARWSGRSERTVRRWLEAFGRGGIAALGDHRPAPSRWRRSTTAVRWRHAWLWTPAVQSQRSP